MRIEHSFLRPTIPSNLSCLRGSAFDKSDTAVALQVFIEGQGHLWLFDMGFPLTNVMNTKTCHRVLCFGGEKEWTGEGERSSGVMKGREGVDWRRGEKRWTRRGGGREKERGIFHEKPESYGGGGEEGETKTVCWGGGGRGRRGQIWMDKRSL